MFHKTNCGSMGAHLPCDIQGYVPELGDSPDQFVWDAAGDQFEGADDPMWIEFVAEAVAATAKVEADIQVWRSYRA